MTGSFVWDIDPAVGRVASVYADSASIACAGRAMVASGLWTEAA